MSLFHSSVYSILSYFTAVLSRGWMESPKTYPRLQLISLRMCLCGKAWRERKSSSTSGDSTRQTSAPAATGRNWCNNSLMTGGHPNLSLTRVYAILEQSAIIKIIIMVMIVIGIIDSFSCYFFKKRKTTIECETIRLPFV